jgi:tagatose 6-phosphate kinase
LQADVIEAAQDNEFVTLSGSLPKDSPLDTFADLLKTLVSAGKRVWVDSSGTALQAASHVSGVALKVNQDEAAELTQQRLMTRAETVLVARSLHTQTGAPVIITLGAEGALLVDGGQTLYAQAPAVDAQNATGSGDCFFAGLVSEIEQGHPRTQCLRRAVAVGTANALAVGGASFDLQDVERLFAKTNVQPL